MKLILRKICTFILPAIFVTACATGSGRTYCDLVVENSKATDGENKDSEVKSNSKNQNRAKLSEQNDEDAKEDVKPRKKLRN